jgi:hypothetical protein
MPEIRIVYDLPSFKYRFVWTATEAEAARLLETQLDGFRRMRVGDPAAALVTAVAQHTSKFLLSEDEIAARGAHVMVTAWVLQLGAENPDFPSARVIDYLPTHDFEVVITDIDQQNRKIEVKITAEPRGDIAGTA